MDLRIRDTLISRSNYKLEQSNKVKAGGNNFQGGADGMTVRAIPTTPLISKTKYTLTIGAIGWITVVMHLCPVLARSQQQNLCLLF